MNRNKYTTTAVAPYLKYFTNKKTFLKRKEIFSRRFSHYMAGSTRFELATSAVTGQCSNQLNYDPLVIQKINMVGDTRFELVTPCL